jgi:hypothetical protein
MNGSRLNHRNRFGRNIGFYRNMGDTIFMEMIDLSKPIELVGLNCEYVFPCRFRKDVPCSENVIPVSFSSEFPIFMIDKTTLEYQDHIHHFKIRNTKK